MALQYKGTRKGIDFTKYKKYTKTCICGELFHQDIPEQTRCMVCLQKESLNEV